MSEPHQPLAAIQFRADDGLGAVRGADLQDGVERRTGCSAVERTLERADRAGDRRNEIRPGGDDDACRKRRCVESVVADGIQIGFERAGSFDRRPVAKQLMEMVRRVREIVSDGDWLEAVAKPPIGSHDGRKRRDRGHRIVDGILLATEAEHRGRHAQGIHRRNAGSRSFAKNLGGGARKRSPRREIVGESIALG